LPQITPSRATGSALARAAPPTSCATSGQDHLLGAEDVAGLLQRLDLLLLLGGEGDAGAAQRGHPLDRVVESLPQHDRRGLDGAEAGGGQVDGGLLGLVEHVVALAGFVADVAEREQQVRAVLHELVVDAGLLTDLRGQGADLLGGDTGGAAGGADRGLGEALHLRRLPGGCGGLPEKVDRLRGDERASERGGDVPGARRALAGQLGGAPVDAGADAAGELASGLRPRVAGVPARRLQALADRGGEAEPPVDPSPVVDGPAGEPLDRLVGRAATAAMIFWATSRSSSSSAPNSAATASNRSHSPGPARMSRR
jgi:hypothetical protein